MMVSWTMLRCLFQHIRNVKGGHRCGQLIMCWIRLVLDLWDGRFGVVFNQLVFVGYNIEY